MDNDFCSINIIPLVDIMLVLVTIVLITSNFMVRGLIPVSLPKSDSSGEIAKEVINVDMTADGAIYFKGEAASLYDLPIMLQNYDRELLVLINADKELTLQPFVTIVDVLKNCGFKRVSLQTEK
jgi:biopolymer transport protein ExbD